MAVRPEPGITEADDEGDGPDSSRDADVPAALVVAGESDGTMDATVGPAESAGEGAPLMTVTVTCRIEPGMTEEIDRTWGVNRYARMAWWLYETQNSADAIGRTNVGLIRLRWLRREGAGWMGRTGMGAEPPPYDYNAQGGCLGWSSTPLHYDCTISNEIDHDGDGSLDDHDGLDAWTLLH